MVASPGRACELVLAEDGRIGAWLLGPSVAAPDLISLVSATHAREQSEPENGLWRGQVLVRDGSGSFDSHRLLKSIGYPGGRAVFGGVIRVEGSPLDGLLLVELDGSAVVRLDGENVWGWRDEVASTNGWRPVSLHLPVGDHRLEIATLTPGAGSALAVRLLARATFAPPETAYWVLPGVSERECSALETELLETSVRWALVEGELVPELHLEAPGGFPRGPTQVVRASVQRGRAAVVQGTIDVAVIPDEFRGPTPHGIIRLPPVRHESTWPATVDLTVRLTVGNRSFERVLGSSFEASSALELARGAVARLRGGSQAWSAPELTTLFDTLDLVSARLVAALEASDWSLVRLESQRLRGLCSKLPVELAPWRSPGIHEVAIRTSASETPERVLVHVPAFGGESTAATFPLVVALHGLNGTPEGILNAFLDRDPLNELPSVDGFVLAPDAFGNTFYRGAGEAAVIGAIDWMLANYPIDSARVSITGVSMGGTGTAHIGLRYAERFSALASLCGYQSYFVRRDTSVGPRADWELASMHHWSPASWADNGAGLGLMVARGTRDTPLSHSRVLVDSFTRLGLRVRTEWPDAGHSIWPIVYDRARLWPWLTAFRRDASPARVVLVTDALRYGKRAWVEITGLVRTGERASVDAERRSNGELVVRTGGILGLTLSPPENVTALSIDGQSLPVRAPPPIAASRRGGVWELHPTGSPRSSALESPARLQKHAGLEGPVHDAFLGRLVFTYGTLDPATRRANREVAEAWARGGPGVRFDYPVVADTEVTTDMHRDASLFLVGSEDDHRLLKRWGSLLPIGAVKGSLRVARQRYDYPEGGALFIYPNPEGAHYVVVLTAPTLGGLWRSFSLPRLLPDYVIWDERLRAATGQQLLGAVPVIAAGRFQEDWALSELDARP